MIYPPWESVAKGELRQNFPTEDKSHNLQVDKHNMSGFYHSHNLHVILIDLVTTTVNSMFKSKLRRISGLSNLERVPPTRTSSGTLSSVYTNTTYCGNIMVHASIVLLQSVIQLHSHEAFCMEYHTVCIIMYRTAYITRCITSKDYRQSAPIPGNQSSCWL